MATSEVRATIGWVERLLVASSLLLVVAASAPRAEDAKAPSPTVLILDDADPDSPFSRALRGQIHSTLDREISSDYSVHTEFLNFGQFDESQHDDALSGYLTAKHRARPPGLIVAIGERTIDFATRWRRVLAPNAAIVFLAFDDESAGRPPPPNATGIVAPRRFADLEIAARAVSPELKQIVIVGGSLKILPYRRHYLDDVRELSPSVQAVDLTGLPLAQIKAQVSNLGPDAVVAYVPLFGDPGGQIHNPGEGLRILAATSNRPIIVDVRALVGAGAIGGSVLDETRLGHEVALRAAAILKGAAASDMPVQMLSSSRLEFDARELQRWNVSEAALPAGAQVLFRDPSVWARFRWQITGAALVLALQTAVIGGLLLERRKRHLAEREAHQHLLEITKMDRALTAGALSSSIAHELNQPLTAIQSNADAASMLLTGEAPNRAELKEIVDDIRRDNQRAAQIIAHFRQLLRQSELKAEELDLGEVITDAVSMLRRHAQKSNVELRTELPQGCVPVRADYVHLQQVILNLVMNAIDAIAAKKSGGGLIEIGVKAARSDAQVTVADSGPGIPDAMLGAIFNPLVTTKAEGTGLGLSIARTIINTYGGRLWAENRASGGAVFRFNLPLVRTHGRLDECQ